MRQRKSPDLLSKYTRSVGATGTGTSADHRGRELAPIGPHPTLPGRNARGHFATANDGHTSIGVFSEKRWASLQSALRDEHTRILAAKGFTDADADPVMSRIVDGFNQAVVMMEAYFSFLMTSGGPISAKGRTRRAVEGWSRAADRVHKFAMALGLEKRARRINQSPVEWLESLNQREGGSDEPGSVSQTERPGEIEQIDETDAIDDRRGDR